MSDEEFHKRVVIPQAILNIIRENLNKLCTGQTAQERARIHNILAQYRLRGGTTRDSLGHYNTRNG